MGCENPSLTPRGHIFFASCFILHGEFAWGCVGPMWRALGVFWCRFFTRIYVCFGHIFSRVCVTGKWFLDGTISSDVSVSPCLFRWSVFPWICLLASTPLLPYLSTFALLLSLHIGGAMVISFPAFDLNVVLEEDDDDNDCNLNIGLEDDNNGMWFLFLPCLLS